MTLVHVHSMLDRRMRRKEEQHTSACEQILYSEFLLQVVAGSESEGLVEAS